LLDQQLGSQDRGAEKHQHDQGPCETIASSAHDREAGGFNGGLNLSRLYAGHGIDASHAAIERLLLNR
jgi:hypothetical protein